MEGEVKTHFNPGEEVECLGEVSLVYAREDLYHLCSFIDTWNLLSSYNIAKELWICNKPVFERGKSLELNSSNTVTVSLDDTPSALKLSMFVEAYLVILLLSFSCVGHCGLIFLWPRSPTAHPKICSILTLIRERELYQSLKEILLGSCPQFRGRMGAMFQLLFILMSICSQECWCSPLEICSLMSQCLRWLVVINCILVTRTPFSLFLLWTGAPCVA